MPGGGELNTCRSQPWAKVSVGAQENNEGAYGVGFGFCQQQWGRQTDCAQNENGPSTPPTDIFFSFLFFYFCGSLRCTKVVQEMLSNCTAILLSVQAESTKLEVVEILVFCVDLCCQGVMYKFMPLVGLWVNT